MWFFFAFLFILILPPVGFIYFPLFWWFFLWFLLPLPWYYRPVEIVEEKPKKSEYKKLRFV